MFRTIAAIMLAFYSLYSQGESGPECQSCHTASADVAVHAIFSTTHGNLGDHTCEACHGDSEAHRGNPIAQSPSVSFGPRWLSDAGARESVCLNCHRQGQTLLWRGSAHQSEDLVCNNCHDLHARRDPALDKDTQGGLCLQCHSLQRSQIALPSRHPVKEGKTLCADCHNPHGSGAPAALRQPTLNDNCYSCHAEKRGPYLFEHAPATEDCSLCHNPHGSINDRLLTSRGPFLCQQCHSAAFHPSVAFSGADLAGGSGAGSPNQSVLGKNCLNCHSQVHGSNHPGGAFLTR